MALGAFGVLYGAWVAFGQTDLKRLVAYTSVSHLGFVLLGVYAWNALALQGAMLQMICHGLSTGALFIVVGQLQERTHTRDLGKLGGLWGTVPRMAGLGLVLALASLGLPGLGNFVAEFLTLVGAFKASVLWTAVATVGLVLATVYSLRVVQGAFHGENVQGWELPDLNVREVVTVGVAVAGLLWLGLYPQPVLDVARPALRGLEGPEAESVDGRERSLPGPGGFGEHRRGDGERTHGPLRSTLASTSPGRIRRRWIEAFASPGADAPRAVLPEPPGRDRSCGRLWVSGAVGPGTAFEGTASELVVLCAQRSPRHRPAASGKVGSRPSRVRALTPLERQSPDRPRGTVRRWLGSIRSFPS